MTTDGGVGAGADGCGAPARAKAVVVERFVEVAIPICVLTAEDCEPSWRAVCQDSPLVGPSISFKVPAGSEEGCILDVPVCGESVQVALPAHAAAGDMLNMTRREDQSWRVVRQTAAFSFLVPACEPGDILKLQVPDGTMLSFTMPEGISPGDFVALRRDETHSWAFDNVRALPELYAPRVRGPYVSILDVLKERCPLETLPRDENGDLRVSIPFCAAFTEHSVLGTFLDEQLGSTPGDGGAVVCATELMEKYYFDWANARRWYEKSHPRLRLETRVLDLAEDMPPRAGLVIGVHPEVTKGGCWFRIVGALLKSARGGACVFATFYEVEMQTLLNMVEMYGSGQQSVEVVENPYYREHPMPDHPPMRYIIIVRDSA